PTSTSCARSSRAAAPRTSRRTTRGRTGGTSCRTPRATSSASPPDREPPAARDPAPAPALGRAPWDGGRAAVRRRRRPLVTNDRPVRRADVGLRSERGPILVALMTTTALI